VSKPCPDAAKMLRSRVRSFGETEIKSGGKAGVLPGSKLKYRARLAAAVQAVALDAQGRTPCYVLADLDANALCFGVAEFFGSRAMSPVWRSGDRLHPMSKPNVPARRTNSPRPRTERNTAIAAGIEHGAICR
jgi:hypothetical protein